MDSVRCPLDAPLTGLVRVAECDARIRSIEVQLIRVETVKVSSQFSSAFWKLEMFL